MDEHTPQVPPLPEQSAAHAAAGQAEPRVGASRFGQAGVDDTGVPPLQGDVDDIGRGFLSALFDISFTTFITRRLASAFYLVGLVGIGIAFIALFFGGIIAGIQSFATNVGAAVSLVVATIIIVPLVAFLAIVVLRFVIEAVVALIAIAENTERTAAHTHDD